MLGTAFAGVAENQGHELVPLARPATRPRPAAPPATTYVPRDAFWDPLKGGLDSCAEGADAVVHLAGASIAGHRWTASRKLLLRQSRVDATRHLVGALGKLRHPPRVFVAASAIGFFGDRGDEELTETSGPGRDFLAGLTRDWEAESLRAAEFGARVVTLRFGVVLARQGGALPQMALPFRFGVGGRVGSGKQWMSWIALEDVVGIIQYAVATDALSGAVNAVSPHPVRNSEFTAILARVLRRPALFPAPAFALRLLFGELAGALLLSSQRVLPAKLSQSAYRFRRPDLRSALEAVLGPS